MSGEVPPGYRLHDWKPDEVTRFWDFVSQAQPTSYFSHRVGDRVAWHFRHLVRGSGSILDYGCGSGRFLEEVLRYGRPAAGFDTSEQSRRITAERLGGVANFLGVLGEDDVVADRGRFDLLFCIEVVEHLDDNTLDLAIAQMRDLIAPGGRLVVTTPNDEDLSESWVCSPESGEIFHRWQHVRSWTGESLSVCLDSAGFRTESTYTCNANAIGRSIRALATRAAYAVVARGSHRNLFVTAVKQ